MPSRRSGYELLKVEENTILEINSKKTSQKKLTEYLSEKSQDDWEVVGMTGTGTVLSFYVLLKQRV